MSIYKRASIALFLIYTLAQAPAANAQVAQILQLAGSVVKVIPKLFKSGQQKNGNNNGQGNDSQSANSNNNNGQTSGSQSGTKQSDSSQASATKDNDDAKATASDEDDDKDNKVKASKNSVEVELTPHAIPAQVAARQASPKAAKIETPGGLVPYCLDAEHRITQAFDHPLSAASVDIVATFKINPDGKPYNVHVIPQTHTIDPKVSLQAVSLIRSAAPFNQLTPEMAAMTTFKVHLTERPHKSYREYGAEVESTVNPHAVLNAARLGNAGRLQ